MVKLRKAMKQTLRDASVSEFEQELTTRLGNVIDYADTKPAEPAGPAHPVAKELAGTMVAQQYVDRDGQHGSVYPVLVPEAENKRIRSASKDVIRSGKGSASYDARNGREILVRDESGPRVLPIDPPTPRKRGVVESAVETVDESFPTLKKVTKTGERLADRIYKKGVIKGNPYKREPIPTVEVELDGEDAIDVGDTEEDISDADTVITRTIVPATTLHPDGLVPLDTEHPDGLVPVAEDTLEEEVSDLDALVAKRGGYGKKILTPTPLVGESANEVPVALSKTEEPYVAPKGIDAHRKEKGAESEGARKGLVDRFLQSNFWRYSVRGEVVEDIVKVGSDEKAVERTVLTSKLLDFVGTIGGSRILHSLPAFFYQKALVSAEQRRILEATTQESRGKAMEGGENRARDLEAKIAESKYLTADKKKVLALRLRQLIEERDSASKERELQIQTELVDVVSRTIKAREDVTTVSRDAINAATMLSGLFVLRAAGYVAATGYKAVRRFEGETKLRLAKNKREAASKEFSTWWNKLRGGDSGRRVRGIVEAVLTIAPTIGVLYQASDWIGLSETEMANKVAKMINQGDDAWQGNGVFESETNTAFTPGESEQVPIVREVAEGQPGQMPAESLPVWRQAPLESTENSMNEALDSKLPAEALPEFRTIPEIATVKPGDGVTWILMRQFKERASELGYDATKDGDIHEWARLKARALAQAKGYLDEKGFETRIKTEAIGSISLVLDENGDGFEILHKNGTPIVPANETSIYFEPVSDTPALLRSQGVEYVSGALEPDDAVRPLGTTETAVPELSTTPAVPESLVEVEDDVDLPEPEPEVEPVAQTPEVTQAGQVAELRVDSYGKMKVFETPDGRYTLDLSKFEIRRRHVEMMQELAISPESIDTPEERAFFQKLFAYAYTLDEMRKRGEEGGRVYVGLAKEVNRLFVSSYARQGIEVNPGNPLILPLLKPEYRIR